MSCPDPGTLQSCADDALPGDDRERIELHLQMCSHCAAHVGRVRALSGALRSLEREATPAHDLWPGILQRTRPRHVRVLLRVAAAVTLFLAGYGAGSLTDHRQVGEPVRAGDVVAAAAEVQRTGSAFTAALANLASAAEAGSDSVRMGSARDVAFASLRGASLELVRLAPAQGLDIYQAAVVNHTNVQAGEKTITRF
jgi:anti-sigma factor RsiW